MIAHPSLLDPNFRKTVLYIATHDAEEGTLGFVLNRPADQKVSDFVSEEEIGLLGKIPVFFGGPVGQDQLTFASIRWQVEQQRVEFKSHLPIDEARERYEEDASAVRAFVGYSGWAKGQLEAELEQKAWVVQKPDRDILDIEKCKGIWPSIVRNFGPWFHLLASAPDDPSLN